MIVMAGLRNFGTKMVIFLAALQDIPAHPYEAARLDGTGCSGTRWRNCATRDAGRCSSVPGMLMLPGMVTFVPQFVLVSNLGLANAYAGLVLPFLAGPFGVFLLRQFQVTVPDHLIEAARVDGAGKWPIFWRVVLPILIVFLVLRRQFMRGTATTGLK
jgi:Binding-protein-dependent transport system inner membrane component